MTRKHGLNSTRDKILSEMRHNPNMTKRELTVIIGISATAIDNNIGYLRINGYIKSEYFGEFDHMYRLI